LPGDQARAARDRRVAPAAPRSLVLPHRTGDRMSGTDRIMDPHLLSLCHRNRGHGTPSLQRRGVARRSRSVMDVAMLSPRGSQQRKCERGDVPTSGPSGWHAAERCSGRGLTVWVLGRAEQRAHAPACTGVRAGLVELDRDARG
jgi:hypothetical protein